MADNGLASFQRRFGSMAATMRANIGGDLVKAAEEIAETVAALAPKDQGALAASVEVTGPGGTTPAYSQPGGSLVVPEGAAAVTVGNNEVRYPHLVEHGTIKTAPQPFFWPGVNLTWPAAAKIIKAGIRRAVRGQA